MASQQTSPTEGPSSAAANAKSDKAKKWAAFRAQNYDGEGWGDDYGEDGGSPPRPPAAAPARPGLTPSTSSPEVTGFANTLPPSVVANLASAQNGSRDSLPSQVTGPRVSTDLTRGIVVSGGSVPAKRAEGRDSPKRRSWVEQRSDSPKPTHPEDSQESRTASDAPTTPIPEADESSTTPSDKRFSRSPQLPDLARMSMFGDDLFKNSFEEPPPMPAMPSPSTFSGAGLGVKQPPETTEGGAGTPGSTTAAAQQTPPQITSASPSPPPAERSASPGDTAAQDNSAAAQSDPAAGSNIPQEGSVSPLVSEGAKTPDSQQAASTLSPSGMAGQAAAPAESTSNVSSLEEPSATDLTREMSPSPLRSMSPAVPTVSGGRSPQDDTPSGATSPVKPTPANDDASDPASVAQQTVTNKTRSSAPRQSDILREEIIKSLGRAAATGEEEEDGSDGAPTDKRRSTLDSGIRESTYLPAVYDDYWADTAGGKDAEVPEVPSLPSGTAEDVAVAPLRPSSKSPGAPSAHPLRKRFSWEQSSEGGPPSPAPARPQDSEAHAEPTARSPVAESSSLGPDREGTTRVEEPDNADAEEETDVSRNESQVSKATAVDPDVQPKRLSLAAEKGLEAGSSTEHLPTEPAEDHPALRDPPEDSSGDATPRPSPKGSPKILPKRQSLQTLSFREIMALGTSQERAAKFEETRLQYAGMDQGLDSWIVTLRAEPEHEGASAIFNANGAAVPVTVPGGAKGQAQTSGQAYYQQNSNASSAQSGGPGRSASVGLGSASPAATALKHSGNQAGVKSKELLFAAGKAGKGLLSKGKNKLRGSTGDKNEAAPPQPHPQPEANIRSVSSGAKIGAGGSSAAPPAHQQPTPTSPNATIHNPPAAQRPPNGTLPPLQPPSTRVLAGNPDLVSPVSDVNSRVSSSDGDDMFAPQGKANAPAGGKSQPWAPVMGSPLAEGEHRDTEGDAGVTGDVKADDKSDDWIVVSPQQISEQAPGEPEAPKEEAVVKDEDASTDAAGQDAVDKTDGKARPPSFAGLPPIRRASTFEPAFGEEAKEEAGEDNDENNGTTLAQGNQVDKLPTISDVRPPSAATSKDGGDSKALEGQTLGNDNITTEGQLLDLVKQKSMVEPPGEPGTPEGHPATREDGTPKAPTVEEPASDQQSSLPAAGPGLGRNIPEHMKANPIQRPPPGQWNLQESYLSEPLISPSRKRPTSPSSRPDSPLTDFDKEVGERTSVHSARSSDNGSIAGDAAKEASRAPEQPQQSGKDVQQMQPQTESAQPPPIVNAPAGIPPNQRAQPVPPGPRPGPKYGATPPVSMQRYRGLFAPPGRPSPPPPAQPGHAAPFQSSSNPHEGSSPHHDSHAGPQPRTSSRPPAGDDKGRRGSGIFSQIGDRFAKISSQGEANDTSSESGEPAPEQRHRRRSSFFLNLKKDTTETGPKSGDSNFANPPSTLEDRSQASASPEEPPKRSFFGVKGRTSTGGTGRFIPAFNRSSTAGPEDDKEGKRFIPAFSRPSTSADEDGRDGRPRFIQALTRPSTGTEEDGKDGKPRFMPTFSRSSTGTGEEDGKEGKSRFGGLGMFRRGTGQEGHEKPGSSSSTASSLQSRPAPGPFAQQGVPVPNVQPQPGQPLQGGGDASLPLPPARGRSGTTGSMPGVPSPLAQASSPPEERGRKISGPGAFLTNIWHNRSSSRSKERKPQQPQPQFGPTGPIGPTGLPIGMAPAPGQQAPRPPSFVRPQTPVHQRRTSAPSPAASPQQRSPTHQRQFSVPENSSPLSRRSATMETSPTKGPSEQVTPAQRTTVPTSPQAQSPQRPSRVDQAGQGRQTQDWWPVSVHQAKAGTESSPRDATPVAETPQGASSRDSGVKADPIGKPDAPAAEPRAANESAAPLTTPTESGEMSIAQNSEDRATAAGGDGLATPKAKKPPSVREPNVDDGPPTVPAINEPKDAIPDVPAINEPKGTDAGPSAPSISEPSKLSSAPTSRSPTPQEAYGRAAEDRAQTPQAKDPLASSGASTASARVASTASVASVESTPSRSQGAVALEKTQMDSVSAVTPQPSSPALSQGQVVSSPTHSRASVGRTVSPPVSSAVAPAPASAHGLAQATQGQPPQGQRPPGQVPAQRVSGQQVLGQPPYGQPPQAGPQGQWRPYVPNQAPATGQQVAQPTPPGFQGQPVPPVSNASTSQHSSPVQFQSAPAPPAQQPQQPEQGHSGVSKWFKGFTSGQQQQQQGQQQQQQQYGQQAPQLQQQSVQSKVEKSAKSFLGAFKRSSKNAAKPPAGQPQAAQSPATQTPATQHGQHPGFMPAGYPQQYGQPQYIMHPQWGMVQVQQPYGPVLQPGQQPFHPAQPLQPGQQFVPAPFPGAFQQMPYAPGQAPIQPYAPAQAHTPSIPPSRQTSVASTQPQSAASPSQSPAVHGPSAAPQVPAGSQPTVMLVPQATAPAGPQPQGAVGPQPSGNRTSTYNANKPLPVPAVVSPESHAAQPPTNEASKTVAALEQAARSGKFAGHSRDVSQASLKPEDARKLTLDTEIAGRKSDETNLYDATPRGGIGSEGTNSAVQSPLKSAAPAAASREDTNGSVATQSAEPATQSTEPTTQSTEPTTQGTQDTEQAKPAESRQQEMIRKMRLEAQDEKILVPGQEGLPGADEEPDDPDKPKMSATSYPGQEWNPYEFYYRED